MDVSELIAEVKREGKVSTDALLMMLSESIQNGEDPMCVYKDIYKKAYGEHLSEKICREWVNNMTLGQKWSMDQTTDVGQRMGINWGIMTKCEWFAALNSSYSDYHKVGQEYQIEEDADFYAGLAKAFWLEDDDVKGKTIFSYYFDYVA